jgi:hypothetical protein
MPLVSIKTGFRAEHGRDEILLEYLCDWPDCGKVAEHVLGVVREGAPCPSAKNTLRNQEIARMTPRRLIESASPLVITV